MGDFGQHSQVGIWGIFSILSVFVGWHFVCFCGVIVCLSLWGDNHPTVTDNNYSMVIGWSMMVWSPHSYRQPLLDGDWLKSIIADQLMRFRFKPAGGRLVWWHNWSVQTPQTKHRQRHVSVHCGAIFKIMSQSPQNVVLYQFKANVLWG